MIDHLCEECKSHFKQVLEFLDELELPYHLNPYLVRGLDYYTRTVFEIFSQPFSKEPPEGQSPLALAGGGRYDLLMRSLGGKDIPACGGAAGIERIIQAMKAGEIRVKGKDSPAVFLAQLGDLAKKKSLVLIERFRESGLPIAESFGKDSLKTQLGRADKIGVKYCLILGQKEVLEGTVIVRNMETGAQDTIGMEKIVEEMKKRLNKS